MQRGRSIFLTSIVQDLNSSITRETFRPPAVLPAQPPTNISSTSKNLEYSGQRLKSAVAKPVVEMIDVTWKNE